MASNRLGDAACIGEQVLANQPLVVQYINQLKSGRSTHIWEFG